MTDGTYIFVRFSDRQNLEKAPEQIEKLTGLVRWDALDGNFQLALRMSDRSAAALEMIKALDGVAETVECRIVKAADGTEPLDPDFCHAYVLAETENDKRDAVQASVAGIDKVLICDTTEGLCDLVAVVRGETFDEVDRIITRKITPVDGLLRLKQDRILSSSLSKE